eukprot:3723949-Rhodomonas_salina.3
MAALRTGRSAAVNGGKPAAVLTPTCTPPLNPLSKVPSPRPPASTLQPPAAFQYRTSRRRGACEQRRHLSLDHHVVGPSSAASGVNTGLLRSECEHREKSAYPIPSATFLASAAVVATPPLGVFTWQNLRQHQTSHLCLLSS